MVSSIGQLMTLDNWISKHVSCNGGRGIKLIQILYESRIIAVRQHLLCNKDRNNLIGCIIKSEEENTIRVEKQLLDLQRIADDISKQTEAISKNFNKSKNVTEIYK